MLVGGRWDGGGQMTGDGRESRVQVASTSHTLHNMLRSLTTQRRALIPAEVLRRKMYGAAAHRHLVQFLSTQEPPPQTAAKQAQLSEYAVPIAGAQRGFQLSAHKNEHAPFMTWRSVKQHKYIDKG